MATLLKTIRRPVSANIKIALVILAFLIVAGTLFFTNRLVGELKTRENRTIQFYANTYRSLASVQEVSEEAMHSTDVLSGVLYDITKMIDFPMITTDADRKIQGRLDTITGKVKSYDDQVRNVDYDSGAPIEQQRVELQNRIVEMGQYHDPIPIYYIQNSDSTVINYVYYDESSIIKEIRLLPYVGIVIISMFIFVGYISFSHVKRNEQSNIWVGMAKETAHQLGTPLSSLLGWIELLRYTPEDTDQVLEAADEMQRDVERLNKIAHRFSKIGSAAEVKVVELNAVLRHVVTYFERRLPHLGKKVALTLDESAPAYVAINTDLFEWVFENLVRNAADAIDHPDGKIRMRVHEVRGVVVIDVSDNGRGIDPKNKKDIFRPGFSTKTRGWGLGLSLAKRIVEEYHGGRIFVKNSSSSGTTFRIRLPAVEAEIINGKPKQKISPFRMRLEELRAR
ncbi:MAG: Signal transduction histidine kinase [Chlorobi bacterium]|nr:Signal transduction histidine kinase [Chlorobiota bacterium]